MATQQYGKTYTRTEQMKRELIGLVIGASLLMTGMAFLVSQVINADSPTHVAAVAPVEEVPAPDAVPASLSPPLNVASMADTLPLPPTAVTINAPDSPDQLTQTQSQPQTQDVAASAPVSVDASAASAQPEQVVPVAEQQPEPKPEHTGWIYAGQFANGKWTEQGLKIGAELPVSGNKYALSWGATVRDTPPGKSTSGGKLGKTVANLSAGREIEILQVKKSGSKGHIWLEIKM